MWRSIPKWVLQSKGFLEGFLFGFAFDALGRNRARFEAFHVNIFATGFTHPKGSGFNAFKRLLDFFY
jgi:hypothetical protein